MRRKRVTTRAKRRPAGEAVRRPALPGSERPPARELAANETLFVSLYDTLRLIARSAMRQQSPAHTLQPTALVNEAFVKLTRRGADWKNRGHFLASAARTMRHILVDHARTRSRVRRRPGGKRFELDDAVLAYEERDAGLVRLDEALEELAVKHPRAAKIVELHYFGKLTFNEISAALGMPLRTVERDWRWARIWLHAELS